jgi:ferric-dicitrate binding protein FerR (iron transport regulator)
MNDTGQDRNALAQAARWHVTLNTLPVSRDALEAFFAWRRIPGNREAFGKIEAFDTRARRLAGRAAIETATQAALERRRARRWQHCQTGEQGRGRRPRAPALYPA